MDIKAYRNWLDQHIDLYDYCFNCDQFRLPNEAVEYFRLYPREPYFEPGRIRARRRIYRPRLLTLRALREHRDQRGNATVLVTNCRTKPVLLLLMDIDAKNGEQDADQLAQFVSGEFFDGRCYIEPSRSGKGRHAYFLLDREDADSHRIKSVTDDLARFIQQRTTDLFRARFDGFYGLPSRWERGPHGKWRLPSGGRGNLLKVPYLPNESDLDVLMALRPVRLAGLVSVLDLVRSEPFGIPSLGSDSAQRRESHTPTPSVSGGVSRVRDMGRTSPSPSLNGWQKKVRLVSQTLRQTNGSRPDLDALYAEYMTNWSPTIDPEDEPRRRADFEKIVGTMVQTFRPTSGGKRFDRHEYVPVAKRLVPDEAFVWERREKLTHERLADFVAFKVQDAFFEKDDEWFARASRNATINNFRKLKAKGLVDWVCTPNQYTKLLKIAVDYGLLQIFEEFVPPATTTEGSRIVRLKGKARLIGPGPSLGGIYDRFIDRYEKHCSSTAVRQTA